MTEKATRLRAQKAFSTDPEYLERMAAAEEVRVNAARKKEGASTEATAAETDRRNQSP